jgi:hypothetical protein
LDNSYGSPAVYQTFNTGDTYEIHKLLIALDQPGRGQSADLITGDSPNQINSKKGIVAWPNQALEPIYSWNNKRNGNNIDLAISSDSLMLLANRDYYNQTPKPGYKAYTYPHPLVTGATKPPANLRIIPGR